jgi:PIN domain nuclease of toxin-antitoxin system
MNLLLDTHIWIWNSLEPWRITSEVNRALADPANELFLSPISIWELVLRVEKNQIVLGLPIDEWIERSREDLMLREASLTWEVARELPKTNLDHRDPADRLLAATAKVHDLVLVTADQQLMKPIPGLRIIANE